MVSKWQAIYLAIRKLRPRPKQQDKLYQMKLNKYSLLAIKAGLYYPVILCLGSIQPNARNYEYYIDQNRMQ